MQRVPYDTILAVLDLGLTGDLNDEERAACLDFAFLLTRWRMSPRLNRPRPVRSRLRYLSVAA